MIILKLTTGMKVFKVRRGEEFCYFMDISQGGQNIRFAFTGDDMGWLQMQIAKDNLEEANEVVVVDETSDPR